jgi:2-succinyl-6-hydroxy-2,4-cyclohexadiene-1-carboxylate synthase
MWDSLAHCTTPVLAMAGTRDTKFVALARRIAALSTTGRLALIADAGHSAHLEQPDAVAQEIGYWIANPTEYNTPITS